MTIAAVLLELGVPAHERPGHDELLEQILRSHGRRCSTEHSDTDHQRAYEPRTQSQASIQKKCAAKT